MLWRTASHSTSQTWLYSTRNTTMVSGVNRAPVEMTIGVIFCFSSFLGAINETELLVSKKYEVYTVCSCEFVHSHFSVFVHLLEPLYYDNLIS